MMDAALANFRWDYIKSEYLVRWINGNETDWYVLQEPQATKNNTINQTVTCPHISTLLKTKNLYLEFNDENGIGTLPYIAGQILAGTGWSIGTCDTFYEKDGVTEKVRSLKDTSKAGAYSLITKMCTLFNAYPHYNGDKTVDFYSLNDNQTEWEFVMGKNLDSISVKYDTNSIVTRLYVEGEYGDYGYVGIDDVEANTSGLSYILNFDYYKELGLFTNAHQAILDQYLIDAKSCKTQISAAQTELNAAINKVVMAVGYTPFTIFKLTEDSSDNLIVDETYRVNNPTRDVAAGDDVIGIESEHYYEHFEWPESGIITPSGEHTYQYVIFFQRGALGQIGVCEAAIEAKEKQIASWQRKIDLTSSEEKIQAYEQNIMNLRTDIDYIYIGREGEEADPGLYYQMYHLIFDGIDMVEHGTDVQDYTDELELIEAEFLSEMGEMLRDGRWSDENYAPGQEDALYADALDMSERCGKPKVTYSMTYTEAGDALGYGVEDMAVNQTGHIWDGDLGVNDYGYIKSLEIVHDNIKESKVDITTDDGLSKQVSLESVMTRIAQMAEIVKAKNAVFERAGAISSSGQLASARLDGMIDLMRNQLSSTVSNWYSDENGNLIFESVNGQGAMMLCGEGFMIASGRDQSGEWEWKTFGTSQGFSADEITTGFLSAERILAGSVTADKISGDYGQSIDLTNNQIMTTIEEASSETLRNARSSFQQSIDEFSLTLSETYAEKEGTDIAIADLQGRATTVEKYLKFGEDYLVIGTTDNNFNVQITNDAINFRNGEQILAYMTNQKLYIAESEITTSQRIGNYLWMLPGSDGAVALIYTGT